MEFEILYTFMPPLVSHEGGRRRPYQGPTSHRVFGDFYTRGLLIRLTFIFLTSYVKLFNILLHSPFEISCLVVKNLGELYLKENSNNADKYTHADFEFSPIEVQDN